MTLTYWLNGLNVLCSHDYTQDIAAASIDYSEQALKLRTWKFAALVTFAAWLPAWLFRWSCLLKTRK
jgi:hypothetical protein